MASFLTVNGYNYVFIGSPTITVLLCTLGVAIMSEPRKATISVFAQILKYIRPDEFDSVVKKHNAEKGSKGFTCWTQFVCMLFGQLFCALSLREIVNGVGSFQGGLGHLGIRKVPARSTLAYANEHRPAEMYKDLFHLLYKRLSSQFKDVKKKFKFKNKLYSIDSTTIELCATIFEWAKYKATKGAVKIHLLLDHQNYLPHFAYISDGKMHDSKILKLLSKINFLPAASIIVFDRGYVDYETYFEWISKGIFFVTRAKDNMRYVVVEKNKVPAPVGRPSSSPKDDESKSKVQADWTIELVPGKAYDACPARLRLITYYDADQKRTFRFLTSNFHLSALTICLVYKDRWAIENFFKCIKQYLNVKTFVGTSANAVKIQIWTALIAMLLFCYLRFISKLGWGLSNFICQIRLFLISTIDFMLYFKDIVEPPPPPPKMPSLLDLLKDKLKAER
jgi:hypothetical protein